MLRVGAALRQQAVRSSWIPYVEAIVSVHPEITAAQLNFSACITRLYHDDAIWARPRPKARTSYGHTWQDEFQWIERGGKRVDRLLGHETYRFQQYMSGTEALQEELLEDMLTSLPDSQVSVPEVASGFEYYVEQSRCSPRRKFLRRGLLGENIGQEEVVLDEAELVAEFGDLISIHQMKLSRGGDALAYTMDKGDGRLSVRLDKLGHKATAELRLPSGIDGDVLGIEWSPCGESLFITVSDDLHRPWRVLHLSIDAQTGQVRSWKEVFREEDPSFFVDIGKTKDWRFLLISSNAKQSSEVRLLDFWRPDEEQKNAVVIQKRRPGVQYFVEHAHGHLFILSNVGNIDNEYSLFRCMPWEEIVPARNEFGLILEDFDIFSRGIAIYGRSSVDGRPMLSVVPFAELGDSLRTQPLVVAPLPAWALSLDPGANVDFDACRVRMTLSSPEIEDTPVDWVWDGHEVAVLCERPHTLPSVHSVRVRIPSPHDGVPVPLTITHAIADTKEEGSSKLLSPAAWVEVYGAYGVSLPVGFDPEKAALLKRGWTVVRAHVRGGGELGRTWHLDTNETDSSPYGLDVRVADLAGCLEYLEKEHGVPASNVVLSAHSAGGAVAAGLAQSYPTLLGALVLEAPFLDMLSTMCDPDLPLTIHEYDEWGDPRSVQGFLEIQASCPYQQLHRGAEDLPPILITISKSDNRVPYWGPLKWAARARALAGGTAPIYVASELHAGHAAHETERLRIAACLQAWAMKALGLAGQT